MVCVLVLATLACTAAAGAALEPAGPVPAEVDYRHLSLDFSQLPAGSVPLPRSSELGGAVLVTGGAGYIGSTFSMLLLERAYTVVVVDNLSRGSTVNVRTLEAAGLAHFYEADIADTARLREILSAHGVKLVIHFAANAFASESVDRPLNYFHNVTSNTTLAMYNTSAIPLNLMHLCAHIDIKGSIVGRNSNLGTKL